MNRRLVLLLASCVTAALLIAPNAGATPTTPSQFCSPSYHPTSLSYIVPPILSSSSSKAQLIAARSPLATDVVYDVAYAAAAPTPQVASPLATQVLDLEKELTYVTKVLTLYGASASPPPSQITLYNLYVADIIIWQSNAANAQVASENATSHLCTLTAGTHFITAAVLGIVAHSPTRLTVAQLRLALTHTQIGLLSTSPSKGIVAWARLATSYRGVVATACYAFASAPRHAPAIVSCLAPPPTTTTTTIPTTTTLPPPTTTTTVIPTVSDIQLALSLATSAYETAQANSPPSPVTVSQLTSLALSYPQITKVMPAGTLARFFFSKASVCVTLPSSTSPAPMIRACPA